MEKQIEKISEKKQELSVKNIFNREDVKGKISEMLGKRSTSFITSVLSVVQNNDYLKKAKPESIYTSAMVAATLDLPINPNLGFAYLIPYGDQCQFQIGYKGLIQLALRSGQFKTINATDVREGELKEYNRLTGEIIFDWNQTSERSRLKVIGYCAFFSLLNGFEKSDFWTIDEVKDHGKKFSKTFSNSNGLWAKDLDSMGIKTVLKLLLAKYAPLSVEMQRAIIADQSVIKDAETMDVDYVYAGVDREEISLEDLKFYYEEQKSKLTEDEIINAERIINNKERSSYKKLNNLLKSL